MNPLVHQIDVGAWIQPSDEEAATATDDQPMEPQLPPPLPPPELEEGFPVEEAAPPSWPEPTEPTIPPLDLPGVEPSVAPPALLPPSGPDRPTPTVPLNSSTLPAYNHPPNQAFPEDEPTGGRNDVALLPAGSPPRMPAPQGVEPVTEGPSVSPEPPQWPEPVETSAPRLEEPLPATNRGGGVPLGEAEDVRPREQAAPLANVPEAFVADVGGPPAVPSVTSPATSPSPEILAAAGSRRPPPLQQHPVEHKVPPTPVVPPSFRDNAIGSLGIVLGDMPPPPPLAEMGEEEFVAPDQVMLNPAQIRQQAAAKQAERHERLVSRRRAAAGLPPEIAGDTPVPPEIGEPDEGPGPRPTPRDRFDEGVGRRAEAHGVSEALSQALAAQANPFDALDARQDESPGGLAMPPRREAGTEGAGSDVSEQLRELVRLAGETNGLLLEIAALLPGLGTVGP